mmetsp:Transcript_4793/g.9980  ORF Transcript_4793/g.9980 Transcript_4793/m.9980 type:complete len:101 (-) Transcript_4793:32-334(-)
MAPGKTNIKVHVHVLEKTIVINCGAGAQRLRWLGIVGISRWDDKDFRGYQYLGVPETIFIDGVEQDMGATVRDVCTDGSEVTVRPSIRDYDAAMEKRSKR